MAKVEYERYALFINVFWDCGTCPRFFVSFCVCVLYNVRVVSNAVSAETKMLERVEPGDCATYHANVKILPIDHVKIKSMTSTECVECHKKGATSLRTKIPLSHIHQLSGVACCDCYEKPKSAESLTTEKCLSCHGSYNEVAEGTAKLDPNPHNSPHYGKELDCDLCHNQHSKSEDFCSQCHMWGFAVP